MNGNTTTHLSRSYDLATKVSRLIQTRTKLAQERFAGRVQAGIAEGIAAQDERKQQQQGELPSRMFCQCLQVPAHRRALHPAKPGKKGGDRPIHIP